MKPSAKAILFAALIGSVLVVDAACTSVSIADRPCPCIPGYVCCDDRCELEAFGCSGSDKKATSGEDDDDTTIRGSSVDSRILALKTEKASPQCITADPTTIFWMNADGIVQAGSTISREAVVSRINPAVTKVENCSLLRSGDGLYVAAAEGNAIQWLSVSSDGANPLVGERGFRFATFNNPVSLVQDATYLYALDGTTGQVRRLEKVDPGSESSDGGGGTVSDGGGIPDGGTVASAGTLLGTGDTQAYSLIVAGDMLYWFDRTGLRRMPKSGGPITTIATTQNTPTYRAARDLQATSDALYWISAGVLTTVPIAGGVAHSLPYTPIELFPSGSGSSSSSSGSTSKTSAGDDDDDTTSTPSSSYRDDGYWIDTLTISDRGLVLGHRTTVGLLGFQGGRELFLYRHQPAADEHTSTMGSANPGMKALMFDTSRFIWISGSGTLIQYRPLLETDPKLP